MNYTFRDFSNISMSAAPTTRRINISTGNTTLFTIVDADTEIATKPARIVFSRSSGSLFLYRSC